MDYEGTRSRRHCSINYGSSSTRSTIVQPLAEACAEHGLAPPRIITECGRAMTAHHAVLVVNVSEVEEAPRRPRAAAVHADEPAVLRHLREIHDELDAAPGDGAVSTKRSITWTEGQSLYALGQLDLRRSRAARRPVLRDRQCACARA